MLINLIIIYFACGSPIGVYHMTRAARLRSPRQAATVGVYFVFWPIFAPAILRSSLFVREQDIERAIAIIRDALEKIAFADRSTVSVFEFREVFARYTGLTLASNSARAAPPSMDLLRVAGHNNISQAAACINRRTRTRLLFHQKRARNEFVEIVSSMASSSINSSEIFELSSQLATLLNDSETADALSVLKSVAG